MARARTTPWKKVYGRDRQYTARKDRADAREEDRARRSDDDQLNLILDRAGRKAINGKEAKRLLKRIRAAEAEAS